VTGRSYRSRLLAGVLVVTVPLVVLLVVTLTTVASRTVDATISDALEDQASTGAEAIARHLDERAADMASVAVLVAAVLEDREALPQILAARQAIDRQFATLQVSAPDGDLIATNLGAAPVDPVGEPWFTAAVDGEPALSRPHVADGRLLLVAAHPVRDAAGDVVAVALGSIRVERFGELLRAESLPAAAEVIVATADARLLYTTDSGTPESDAQLLADGSLDIEVDPRNIDRALTSGLGSGRFVDYKGQRVVGAYAPVPGRDLVVVARAPEAQVLAAERRLLLVGALLGLLGLAALALFGRRFAARETAFLRLLTSSTEDAAVSVKRQAEGMAASSVELASTTTEQSATVTQTSTTMEELSRSAASIADTAQDVASQADMTREGLLRAGAELESASRGSLELAEQVRRVTAILAVIDELAERTDMLALNAAIEAARAGEAGEGFAVVAEEVRRLAERSRASAADIGGIIEATESQMTATLLTLERSGTQMRDGLALLEDVAMAAEQVRLTTQQQQLATDQVVDAMAQATESAAQLASTAEEIAHGAAALARTAEALEASASDARQRF
jgi:methyl-accepting chemotaxis protein